MRASGSRSGSGLLQRGTPTVDRRNGPPHFDRVHPARPPDADRDPAFASKSADLQVLGLGPIIKFQEPDKICSEPNWHFRFNRLNLPAPMQLDLDEHSLLV
jgi:hypothetical protein